MNKRKSYGLVLLSTINHSRCANRYACWSRGLMTMMSVMIMLTTSSLSLTLTRRLTPQLGHTSDSITLTSARARDSLSEPLWQQREG